MTNPDSLKGEPVNQAEQETIERFCRELALVLRHITGRSIELTPQDLPILKESPATPAAEPDAKTQPEQKDEQA